MYNHASTMHSGPFCINLAHFSGNFRELKKYEEVRKIVLKGQKGLERSQKVHFNHETIKKGLKFVQ